MVFSDPVFVFGFLPIAIVAAITLSGSAKRISVLILSMLCFSVAGAIPVLVMAGSIVSSYVGIKLLGYGFRNEVRRVILIVSVLANVSNLTYWKYAMWVTGIVGFNVTIVLPVAISFYTFQTIGVLVDVYRDSSKRPRSLSVFALYVTFFPQLVAGPIVRWDDVRTDIEESRRSTLWDVGAGFPRFLWGLSKKILIADQIAPIANSIFDSNPADLSSSIVLLGVLTYALQIYFDFSGYSDMALGLAAMFGFHFAENFRHPYSASSVTDFWRRWHMSLSTFFRDYVYIPLGGNRKSSRATVRNLLIVFMLTGLWHGANLTFLIWAMSHAVVLICERQFRLRMRVSGSESLLSVTGRRLITQLFIVLSWLPFRSESVSHLLALLGRLFTFAVGDVPIGVLETLSLQRFVHLGVGCVAFALPGKRSFGEALFDQSTSFRTLRIGLVLLTGLLAMTYCLSAGFSPFLYFQF